MTKKSQNPQKLIKSKKRVVNYGEVYTPEWLVKDMVDLVHDTVERLDSTVLEPACGNGNFLVEILDRKLHNVTKDKYIIQALIAVASLYGIDILEDNVIECRRRLFDRVINHHQAILGSDLDYEVEQSLRFVLGKNIIHGDTLAMTQVKTGEPILIYKFSYVGNEQIVCAVFRYKDLVEVENAEPIKVYPAVDYRRLYSLDS